MKTVLLLLLLPAAIWKSCQAASVFQCRVLQEFEHDTSAFTEGLVFREADGALIESTGLSGKSLIREFSVDLAKGSLDLVRTLSLPDRHFGEGVTYWKEELLSLTWKSGKVHVYDAHTTAFKETIALDSDIHEGWGLTQNSDRSALIASDGSSVLHHLVREDKKLSIAANVPVHDCSNDMPYVLGINELELVPRAVTSPQSSFRVRGAPPGVEELSRRSPEQGLSSDLVWGNIITTMCIAAIDPITGSVQAWILLDGIYDNWDPYHKVANGIAYRAADGTLWITGKDWSMMFRVALEPHPSPDSVDIKNKCTTKWKSYSYNVDKVVGRPVASPCS